MKSDWIYPPEKEPDKDETINEIVELIKPLDMPIRLDEKTLSEDLHLKYYLNKITRNFRLDRFSSKMLKIDIINTHQHAFLANISKTFNKIEKRIWDKNLKFNDKYLSLRKYDFFTFRFNNSEILK